MLPSLNINWILNTSSVLTRLFLCHLMSDEPFLHTNNHFNLGINESGALPNVELFPLC